MNQVAGNQTEIVKSPPSIKSTLVHLEEHDRADRALCGASVKIYLPDDTQLDCVVCAELAREQGYDV